MEIGTVLVLGRWLQDDIGNVASGIESLGYRSLLIGDHVVLPEVIKSEYPYNFRFPGLSTDDLFPSKEFPGALTTAGYLCGSTSTLRIGFGVLLVSMRNAVVAAKEIGSLHALSGERLLVGVGSGWLREEFEAIGMPFGRRGQLLDESIDLMRSLWSSAQPVSFHGPTYSFENVYCEPYPNVAPPVWIGGHSEPALRRSVQRGDGWYALDLPSDEVSDASRRLDELCEAEGRDPSSLTRAVSVRLPLQRPNPSEIARALNGYLEAKCDHLFIMSTPSRSGIENLQRFETVRSVADSLGMASDLGFNQEIE